MATADRVVRTWTVRLSALRLPSLVRMILSENRTPLFGIMRGRQSFLCAWWFAKTRVRRRIARTIFIVVIARSEATKQSRTSPKTGLLRSARNDERDVAYEKGQPMPTKYPNGMRLTQWRRTPFRKRHRLLAFAINNALGHWRSCADRRCRRARGCRDHECY